MEVALQHNSRLDWRAYLGCTVCVWPTWPGKNSAHWSTANRRRPYEYGPSPAESYSRRLTFCGCCCLWLVDDQ